MSQAVPLVKIILLQRMVPAGSGLPCPDSSTLAPLRRLGGEVEIELVSSVRDCVARAGEPGVDLIIAEPGAAREELLQASAGLGPPVVVVLGAEEGAAAAREAFSAGAADCVSVDGNSAEALPVVALEQIRHWRAQRARAQQLQRMEELRRYNENIIQNMNSALLVMDGEGLIRSANPSAEQILGTEPGPGRRS